MKAAFESHNCRRITQSGASETTCLVWLCLSLALGIVGNLMTLIAIPYAKINKRCHIQVKKK